MTEAGTPAAWRVRFPGEVPLLAVGRFPAYIVGGFYMGEVICTFLGGGYLGGQLGILFGVRAVYYRTNTAPAVSSGRQASK